MWDREALDRWHPVAVLFCPCFVVAFEGSPKNLGNSEQSCPRDSTKPKRSKFLAPRKFHKSLSTMPRNKHRYNPSMHRHYLREALKIVPLFTFVLTQARLALDNGE